MPDRPAANPEAGADFLPYGCPQIGEADVEAVTQALVSGWLTTGPQVGAFEQAFAAHCGAGFGVAVNSGTAALHAAMRATGLRSGDEVIVPALTFAASANAALYENATPVFADVEEESLLIDPHSVERLVSSRTRAIVAVDYAGQPASYDALRAIAEGRGIRLIADACHSPGAVYRGRKSGTLADISCFSFHPVKHMTTCEGGMCTTEDAELAAHMRRFRNHGIDSDHYSRQAKGLHAYDMVELGYNYRMPDALCALGLAQLPRLGDWVAARRKIADFYDRAFASLGRVMPLKTHPDRENAYHLYVVRLAPELDRDKVFAALRAEGIGANVHYAPVYAHSFYRRRGYPPGLCPAAERAARQILTLPLFPAMNEEDANRVVTAVTRATA